MAGFKVVEDNTDEIISEVDMAKTRALEMIGIAAEKFAKALCPVGTPESTGKKGYRGGTLRNSITHQVEGDTLVVGSNVEYAPYVELGTGPYFQAPPEWEQFESAKGSGVGHAYVRPRPFIKPAIADHISLYERIIRDELSK